MKKLSLVAGVCLGVCLESSGSGFALYEPTARATAYAGALLGRGVDGSANSINPATLTDITNITVTAGFVTEHPRARIKVNGEPSRPMDPGFFVLPHVHVVSPLLWGFSFGFGVTPDYGLGTHYTHDNTVNWSSREVTIKGFVFNPNLAYRINDDWSVGVGARILFFDFEQYSYPQAAFANPYTGQAMSGGTVKNHLEGDNGTSDAGWQIGTSYRILDNLSAGIIYKSKIDVHVKGKTTASMRDVVVPSAVSSYRAALNGPAGTTIELPQSVAFGLNWDMSRTWHLGTMVSWTDWSSIDTLAFRLNGNLKPIGMHWKDTWRFAIAPSWDFARDWTAILSYVYDSNCCPSDQQSTMLPPGDRQIVTGGLCWQVSENLACDMSYGLVVMGCKTMRMRDALGQEYSLAAHRGLSHAVGFSVTYRF